MDKKIALVTGSGGGIGRNIALKLAEAGYYIVVSDVVESGIEETVKLIKEKNQEAIGIILDVSSYDDVENKIKEVIDKLGRIDILVNNAGITKDNLFMRMKKDEWDRVLQINLYGVFNCCKAVIRNMMKNRYGRIVNISSVIGLMGNAGQANYAASKAGIIGLTKSLAKECGSRNITVNAIAPGFIKTKMTEVLSDEVKAQITKNIPMQDLGTTEDVANLVEFLASDKARYITGEVIRVDGGLAM